MARQETPRVIPRAMVHAGIIAWLVSTVYLCSVEFSMNQHEPVVIVFGVLITMIPDGKFIWLDSDSVGFVVEWILA